MSQQFVVKIRETECIGCTKCLEACPFDAIIGASKQMHTVLAAECTGCELCVAPCPVDCIDIIPATQSVDLNKSKQRVIARKQRRKLMQQKEAAKKELVVEKSYIQAALERAKMKGNNGVRS